MYSFIFFYLVSSFISAVCFDLMSIVQVAFVNPLINELCMYVRTGCPSCHPTISVEATKEIQSIIIIVWLVRCWTMTFRQACKL